MRSYYSMSIICIVYLGAFPSGDNSNNGYPVSPGAALQLIGNDFSFTEGPAADAQGNVFFTDQPNNRIWKYDTAGNLSLFMENTGRANGMFFDKKNNLIVCADEHNQLWSVSGQKKIKILLKDYKGRLLNGPNDVWVSPAGGIYFTDPYYQRDYWTRKEPDLETQGLYYLPPGADKAICIDDSLKKPNGIVGTADGKKLYVADIDDNKTYVYSIRKDGMLNGRTLFVDHGSDGMTIDADGNVYLCGDGVTVYNWKGIKINHIPVPAKWTANVCFGGTNKDWLFITASEKVFKLKMDVRGVK